MSLRLKYFLYNLGWVTVLFTLVNIIAYNAVPDKDMSWSLVIKIQIVFFVITSLLSQIDIRQKSDDTFISNWNSGMEFLTGAMAILTIGFIVVGIIHAFLVYDTFYITKYLFGFLIGTTGVVFMTKIYFTEA